MTRTNSIYVHFDFYLTPIALTFNLPEKNVSNGTSPPRGQQLCKIILKSVHKCTSYGQDKLNLWPFWPLFDPCDLDLQLTWKKNVSNSTTLPLPKLFWNLCINVQVMARTSSIYDNFHLYLAPVTLTFNLPEKKMYQMPLPRWQQLCKIILKSMHKCTSYGPDKLNSCIWLFWPLFDPCDLDLKPT